MNSNVSIVFLSFIMLLFSCQEEKVHPPDDLIPEERFIEIMVEMNLIEAVKSIHTTKEQRVKAEPAEFYNHLWESKDISEDQFLRSFEFYRKDLDKMAHLYERASQKLKRKEDELKAGAKSKNQGLESDSSKPLKNVAK